MSQLGTEDILARLGLDQYPVINRLYPAQASIGKYARKPMVLLKGAASIRVGKGRNKVCVDQLQPGSVYLEPVLPKLHELSFDLYTNTPCVFAEIPMTWDELVMGKDHTLAGIVLKDLARSLGNVRSYLLSMRYDDVETRIASLLVYLALSSESESESGEWIPLAITYAEIGAASHCSIRQVHRVISELRDKDLIRSSRRGTLEIHRGMIANA